MSLHTAVYELLRLLDLEEYEADHFIGDNDQFMAGPRLFGGQILAQSLRAAYRTLAKGRLAHSLHAQFLRPGSKRLKPHFLVERVRDGRSFSLRRVEAVQKGACIFKAMISFQTPEIGLQHQREMQSWPAPDQIEDDVVVSKRLDTKYQKMMPWLVTERAFEMRSVYPLNKRPPDTPVKPAWVKLRSKIESDDEGLHQCLIAYASDMGLMSTSLIPHLRRFRRGDFMGASLDHALWFHAPMRADRWWMYDRESEVSHGARGYNRALIYNRDGKLCLSASQESLARLQRRPMPSGGGNATAPRATESDTKTESVG